MLFKTGLGSTVSSWLMIAMYLFHVIAVVYNYLTLWKGSCVQCFALLLVFASFVWNSVSYSILVVKYRSQKVYGFRDKESQEQAISSIGVTKVSRYHSYAQLLQRTSIYGCEATLQTQGVHTHKHTTTPTHSQNTYTHSKITNANKIVRWCETTI